MYENLPTTNKHFELQALKDYCFTQFRDINLILREDISNKQEFDEKYKKIYGAGTTSESMYNSFLFNITTLDKMFNNLRCESEITTYRKFSISKVPELEKGIVFIDKGYVSTSIKKDSLQKILHSDILSYNAIAKIIVPVNTKCVYIGDIFNRKEDELLLCRGLKYKLLDVEDNTYTFTIV